MKTRLTQAQIQNYMNGIVNKPKRCYMSDGAIRAKFETPSRQEGLTDLGKMLLCGESTNLSERSLDRYV